MYVGKKYSATKTGAFEREFRCKRCGFTSDAMVMGIGTGQGNSAYFLDNEGAAERAQRSAETEAEKNADLTIKLCPCPKCGARDDKDFITHTALSLVGMALFLWGLGWVLAQIKGRGSSEIFFWIFGVIGLVTPIAYFFAGVKWKWTTAEGRVAFLKRDEPEKAKTRAKRKSPKKARAKRPLEGEEQGSEE